MKREFVTVGKSDMQVLKVDMREVYNCARGGQLDKEEAVMHLRMKGAGLNPWVWCMVFASCGVWGNTPIREILDNPMHFHRKEVIIRGKVVDRVNLAAVKYYVVDDGTGKIPVITEGPLPPEGEEVRVKGVVYHAISLMGHTMVVVKEAGEDENPRSTGNPGGSSNSSSNR